MKQLSLLSTTFRTILADQIPSKMTQASGVAGRLQEAEVSMDGVPQRSLQRKLRL